jgi:hypothetical protein
MHHFRPRRDPAQLRLDLVGDAGRDNELHSLPVTIADCRL